MIFPFGCAILQAENSRGAYSAAEGKFIFGERIKIMIKHLPPMGWNTWNTFAQNISEELILQSADAMVETGLKDEGYEYIVIDDCWALRERDKAGNLVPDPAKFPHGMKYVADYIHSKGLKFGMYSCCGTMTCARYPAKL